MDHHGKDKNSNAQQHNTHNIQNRSDKTRRDKTRQEQNAGRTDNINATYRTQTKDETRHETMKIIKQNRADNDIT